MSQAREYENYSYRSIAQIREDERKSRERMRALDVITAEDSRGIQLQREARRDSVLNKLSVGRKIPQDLREIFSSFLQAPIPRVDPDTTITKRELAQEIYPDMALVDAMKLLESRLPRAKEVAFRRGILIESVVDETDRMRHAHYYITLKREVKPVPEAPEVSEDPGVLAISEGNISVKMIKQKGKRTIIPIGSYAERMRLRGSAVQGDFIEIKEGRMVWKGAEQPRTDLRMMKAAMMRRGLVDMSDIVDEILKEKPKQAEDTSEEPVQAEEQEPTLEELMTEEAGPAESVTNYHTRIKSDCVHHFVVESPNGQKSKGECKHCGEKGTFSNRPPEAVMDPFFKAPNRRR
ncbi:MAG: hypothetical protein ACM3IJ_01180 [Candidatus Levyibacteriota bacterium]